MSKITALRKVVIDHCRRLHKASQGKKSPEEFHKALMRISSKAAENDGILTSEQAWIVAEETWSFVTRFIEPIVAPAFAGLDVPGWFEEMPDDERVATLAAGVLVVGDSANPVTYARILSMGIRIATDALLASSPEIFQEGRSEHCMSRRWRSCPCDARLSG